MCDDWPTLLRLARAEVEATLEALPRRLRAAARTVPVVYEPQPSSELVADGLEPDTLGLFVGDSYAHADSSAGPLPSQIILFLENLRDFAEDDEAMFREEVRRTLMHELGHYLGLDEADLTDRGLE
jgi:predicted Zn-dependent protease with MMP-like domain